MVICGPLRSFNVELGTSTTFRQLLSSRPWKAYSELKIQFASHRRKEKEILYPPGHRINFEWLSRTKKILGRLDAQGVQGILGDLGRLQRHAGIGRMSFKVRGFHVFLSQVQRIRHQAEFLEALKVYGSMTAT
jgi:hypothetical protein